MEYNLTNAASRLQSIIDTAIDGIITIDTRGIVETINNSAARLFEYESEEVIGQNIKLLMPEPYHSEHDGYLKRYKDTKKPKIIGTGRDVIGKKKGGGHFPFRLAVSEVYLNDRVIYTGIIHDKTELNEVEENLLELNEKLEEKVEKRTNELEEVVNNLLSAKSKLEVREQELNIALSKEKELNDLKSRFVSMASHEFRTPLSTILSSASLISKYQEKGDNEKSHKHIEKIKTSVNILTGILNDFLSLSKIEEGKVEVNSQDIDINKICKSVIEEMKGVTKGKKKLTFISEKDSIHLSSDPRILKNILFNLVSNAVKYTEDNKGKITVTTIVKDGECFLSVEDNGIGIPQSDQKHLFQRFFRASNVENIQGTGLGLSIIRRYLSLLNGSITFESKEFTGTKFTVKIPLLK